MTQAEAQTAWHDAGAARSAARFSLALAEGAVRIARALGKDDTAARLELAAAKIAHDVASMAEDAAFDRYIATH